MVRALIKPSLEFYGVCTNRQVFVLLVASSLWLHLLVVSFSLLRFLLFLLSLLMFLFLCSGKRRHVVDWPEPAHFPQENGDRNINLHLQTVCK